MQLKIRYDSFDQFFRLNKEDFQKVQKAKTSLKSPQELGMTGNALCEAERLAYEFLNLKNLVSDLLFGLGASVLDSKHDIKVKTAIAYRNTEGPQGDKKVFVEADTLVIKSVQTYNDLVDLKEYLDHKYSDFESVHFYYKHLSQGKSA